VRGKNQSVAFHCISKNNKPFLTNSLEQAVSLGKGDPHPVNRKSRRAMAKMTKKMLAGYARITNKDLLDAAKRSVERKKARRKYAKETKRRNRK